MNLTAETVDDDAVTEDMRRTQHGKSRRWARRHPVIGASAVLIVVAATATGLYFGFDGDSAASQASTITQTVSTGTIEQSVSASGTLAPKSQKELNFSVSGTVTHVWAREGDHVRKGQRLARVNSASLAASVAQAKATVASDRAGVHDDKTNGAGKTQVRADRSALQAARNQLTSARGQLSDATLRSPITGLVASVNLNVGDAVSSSSSNNSGSSSSSTTSLPGLEVSSSTSDAQVLVISTKRWKVNGTVDATQVGLIKAGDQARLSVTGVSGSVYGTITSVGLVSSSSSGTASYPVVIDVTGTKSGLHDGASVTATLIYRKLSNVVTISATALHRDASGSSYVEQVINGRVVHTRVTVGITSGAQVQIKSGLSTGDKILVPQTPLTRGGTSGAQPSGGNLPSFPGGGRFPGGGQFPGGSGGFPGGGGFGGN